MHLKVNSRPVFLTHGMFQRKLAGRDSKEKMTATVFDFWEYTLDKKQRECRKKEAKENMVDHNLHLDNYLSIV